MMITIEIKKAGQLEELISVATASTHPDDAGRLRYRYERYEPLSGHVTRGYIWAHTTTPTYPSPSHLALLVLQESS